MQPMQHASRRMDRRRQGFTLIEMMVAMTVVAVGLFAVVHLMVVSIRASAYARERTVAIEIAGAVAEELRARCRAWTTKPGGTFADAFPEIALTPPPPPGTNIDPANLRAFEYFGGSLDVTSPAAQVIGGGSAPPTAFAINQWGAARDLLPGDIRAEGAIFRLHYTAHQFNYVPGEMNMPPGATVNDYDMVLMIVFVSWDNKDHGSQRYDWATWHTAFWQRHLVAVPVVLRPIRLS
jgi:type IV pilus assembly protein PilV